MREVKRVYVGGTATHRNTPQHTTTHYNTLQQTATHCNALQHAVTRCNTLQHSTAHSNTPQTHCNTDQEVRVGCKHIAHTLQTHCSDWLWNTGVPSYEGPA